MSSSTKEEHWSSEAYQHAASFVPKLATKIIGWLDVQPDDLILDIGCGDGVLNLQIAKTLATGKGKIHGIDSSAAMIAAATRDAQAADVSSICTFEVFDAVKGPNLTTEHYDKVFSNAAMHWILRPSAHRAGFFRGVHEVLKPSGVFIFEMGGMGNVAELRTALLSVVGARVGLKRAREVDPWFFPDEQWTTAMMEGTVGGFKIEKIEREYRATPADSGGIEAWIRLMGKQFLDAVEDRDDRERCVIETCDLLQSICESPSGGQYLGYVRLRVLARRI
ncbi:methyltransferase type 11 [Phlyctema vagabunda]|uniref:Methyltransferase type 11 n=1 Tax=Phlyctema vagabunda TaxID=108571 RepID=A0ABR4PJD2_9HELO